MENMSDKEIYNMARRPAIIKFNEDGKIGNVYGWHRVIDHQDSKWVARCLNCGAIKKVVNLKSLNTRNPKCRSYIKILAAEIE